MNYYNMDGKKLTKKTVNLEFGYISVGTVWEKGKIVECAYYHPFSIEEQIAKYKTKLKNTDYISAKIADGAATREEYSDMLKQRAEWRKQINKLEEELNSNV